MNFEMCVSFIEIRCSTTRGLNADFTFQGEMGPEGLRGLPGEEGKKGAKVRSIIIFNLHMFI